MIRRSHIGKSYSIGYKPGTSVLEHSGIILNYSEEWVLLRHNPVDYVIDGFILLRRKHITSVTRGKWERFKDELFSKKKGARDKAPKVPIESIEEILTYLTRKYGVFMFDMRSDSTCWLGRVKYIKGSRLKIDDMGTRGEWTKNMPEFILGNIRSISFDNDYVNSLMLVSKRKK